MEQIRRGTAGRSYDRRNIKVNIIKNGEMYQNLPASINLNVK
jgi:hypothetical protein